MGNILIVEDDDDLRIKVKDFLISAFPSSQVFDVADADKTLKIFSDNPPDIIILDLRLPGKSGLWLIERLKPRFSKTVFIVNSNYDSPEYKTAAFQRGADFFLSKKENSINDIRALIKSVSSASIGKDYHYPHGFDGCRKKW